MSYNVEIVVTSSHSTKIIPFHLAHEFKEMSYLSLHRTLFRKKKKEEVIKRSDRKK